MIGDRFGRDAVADAFSDLQCGVVAVLQQQDDEFLPAETPQRAVGPQMLLDPIR